VESFPYFYSDTAVRFVVRGLTGIYGVIIDYSHNPCSVEPPARAVKLMEFPPADDAGHIRVFFGSNSAVILDDNMETYLIKYSWPDNNNGVIPASWLRIERTLEECKLGLLVDVESGRVVACGAAEQDPGCHHLVWDFSLIYKSES
jgi:hypothetical protein